jgi:hypothetical protein
MFLRLSGLAQALYGAILQQGQGARMYSKLMIPAPVKTLAVLAYTHQLQAICGALREIQPLTTICPAAQAAMETALAIHAATR